MSERGIAEMMVKLCQVATARGLVLVDGEGFVEFTLGDYAVTINGRTALKNSEGDEVPRYSALVKHSGWPVAMCNPASGMTLGGSEPGEVERAIIAACDRALAAPTTDEHNCRRCSVCTDHSHHWMENFDEGEWEYSPDPRPVWGCKHCDFTMPYTGGDEPEDEYLVMMYGKHEEPHLVDTMTLPLPWETAP